MKVHQIAIAGFLALAPVLAQTAAQIEPKAGAWKTWVISSGKDFRVFVLLPGLWDKACQLQ